MTHFLTTYLMHSTVLLAMTLFAMRIGKPRSSVLVERLWKLSAVLPVATALLMSGLSWLERSPTNEPVGLDLVAEEDQSEPVDEIPSVMSVTVSPMLDWEPQVATSRQAELADEPPLCFGQIESLTRRMGTLARPFDEENDDQLMLDETGRSAHPPVVEIHAEVTQTPNASEPDTSPALAAELAEPVPSSDSHSWLRSSWQAASVLLPSWVVIGSAWLLIRSAWFRWRLRNARRVDRGRVIELLRELTNPEQRAATWPKPIRVLIVPGFAEPAAFGIWRPTIVLPPSCESLDREAMRAVLAHELGHIARGDLWWLAIGRVLTTCLGFQPLNRIARREWTAAAECLCDAWAVDQGVERLTLARCLTALAEHRLTGVSLADALAAVGSPSSLRTRIERLVADPVADPWARRSRRWLLSGSVIAAAVGIAMLTPLPEIRSPLATASEPDAELAIEIEAELNGLREELQRAEQLAHERNDADGIDTVERLRDRERQLVERWRSWTSD